MRTYEMLFLLKPDLSEEAIAESKDRLRNITVSAASSSTRLKAGAENGWRSY